MKISTIILMLIVVSFNSFSQVERKPAPAKQADTLANNPAANRMDKANRKDLLKDLNLTREQKIKLREMRQANMAKKEAIENNSQLSAQEKKMQLKELQKEQAKNVQAILTDEQREKFKAKRKEAMEENN